MSTTVRLNKTQKEKLWEIFKSLGETAIGANQYELAELCEEVDLADLSYLTSEYWSAFLKEPDVIKYRSSEMQILKDSALIKMVANSSDSRSVAQSQLINALQKIESDTDNDKGPAFIYCYVPLTSAQKHAPTATELDAQLRKLQSTVELTKEEKEWVKKQELPEY
jgi:hypothetical protein